ncbi:tegument host shutoff protein [Macropodid alphaherpesvirus 1]|uniref:Virion host shutoff protein n=1 Tax=Macropodid alphaherpesvirus 1 TaxID=137443 RepID=A0A120HUI3_9ALPH|nr:tegument host shutoff protein [Macropodid alphaherpesvirus 1]AMB17019.1 tegument host shutoff protein [Macropodid alphaherpesvirus 1]
MFLKVGGDTFAQLGLWWLGWVVLLFLKKLQKIHEEMGLFGMMKFAHTHHLVKRRSLQAPAGYFTPIAVDLWNVMYTLVFKYQQRYPHCDREAITLRCLCGLLKVFAQKSLFPIFVSDRGVDGIDRVIWGAKAILARTQAQCKNDAEVSGQAPSPLPSPLSTSSITFFSPESRGTQPSPDGGFRPLPCSKKSPKPALRIAHHFCIQLIRALGYAYLNSGQMEADDACANLYHTNTVAYVHTTDTDLLLMGCDIVLDISTCYIPTIRCKDLLNYLKMSYPQFLALFVRCHTDLHPNNTHACIDDVLRECGWAPPKRFPLEGELPSISSSTVYPDLYSVPSIPETRISWTYVLANQTCGDMTDDLLSEDPIYDSQDIRLFESTSSSEIRAPPELVTVSEDQLLADHHAFLESRRRHIIHDAKEALDWLSEPVNMTDLVERRYVKYVISLMAPKKHGSWTVLKRLPIYQDCRDENLAKTIVQRHVPSNRVGDNFISQLLETVPSPPKYQTVLQQFWDNGRGRMRA